MTITAPITDDTGESIEEDEDIDLRGRLGFRSPLIASNGPHPDSEHCPSWCWLTADNPQGYDHEIDPHHPHDRASHTGIDTLDRREPLPRRAHAIGVRRGSHGHP